MITRANVPRSRQGFTLFELSVVLVVLSLMFMVILPNLQAVRHRENYERAQWHVREIATACFQYYHDHGEYPDRFELQDYLEPELWTAIVNDQSVDGSKLGMTLLHADRIELFTVVDNPMRVVQTLAVTLDRDAALAFQRDGTFPPLVTATDESAALENATRMQEIVNAGMKAVKCAGDFTEIEAREQIDKAWNDRQSRQAARGLLDRNADGFIARDEIFDAEWDAIPFFGDCIQDFTDFSRVALAFEEDEPNYAAPAVHQGLWHHALLSRLFAQVNEMRATSDRRRALNQLTTSLDQTGASLRTAQLSGALEQMEVFQQQLSALVLARIVPEALGSPALTTADFFQAALVAKLFTIPDPSPHLENPVVLYVDWRGSPDPDTTGTADDPFPSVVRALAHAEEKGFAAIEIVVRPGTYRGPLAITRHTRILSAEAINAPPLIMGKLVNEGPFALELLNLQLTSEDGVPGVIAVNHPAAWTYLVNVRIGDALGFAIHQTGGDFRCHNLAVNWTDAYSADVGIAIQFDGGVHVELNDVEMVGNRAGALLLSGDGTRARVNGLEITQTRANIYALQRIKDAAQGNPADFPPDRFQPGTCAVDVRNGAYLEGENLRIVGNEYVGLYVHARGRAVLHDCHISSTSHVTQVPQGSDSFNVVVRDQGSLEMTSFTVSYAEIGLNLAGDIDVRFWGTEDAHSEISNCTVGFALSEGVTPDYVQERLQHVDLRNLEKNVVALTLPVPGTVSPVPSE
jgi:prepilin-type N-terminal cleavage/methylation domain-containing protein